jgi:hypothetical protein
VATSASTSDGTTLPEPRDTRRADAASRLGNRALLGVLVAVVVASVAFGAWLLPGSKGGQDVTPAGTNANAGEATTLERSAARTTGTEPAPAAATPSMATVPVAVPGSLSSAQEEGNRDSDDRAVHTTRRGETIVGRPKQRSARVKEEELLDRRK